VEEGKSELDKVLEGSSYELGLYISNQVLRGEVRRLREELVGVKGQRDYVVGVLEAEVKRYKQLCGEGVYKKRRGGSWLR